MLREAAWLALLLPLSACGELIGIDDAQYEVMAVCRGDQAQYPSRETCLAVCATLPPGEAGSRENNLACRSRQVELAAIEPLVHCAFAGPGGGGECGSNCEGLCSITMPTCSAATASDYYADYEACLADCLTLPDLGEYGAREEYSAGGHVQCRLYHVTAATQDAERHCPHALGESPCVSE
jgi:hypothetical protein